jgi:sortase A
MDASFTTPPVPAQPRRPHRLAGDALRRPGGRRALSVLSIVLAIAGVGMFAYPFFTDLQFSRIQSRLETQFTDPTYRDAYRARKIGVGDGLTRLTIPKLDVDVLVVEGTTPAALKAGAGHYMQTPLPGEVGNVGIAGHRTTYGRPFNRMDELRTGDVVFLDTPFERFEYKVLPGWDGHANPYPVSPDRFDVVGPPRDPKLAKAKLLTLTTCHPKGSAKQRLIVHLELSRTLPLPKA